jgi:hypothetical protein
VVLPCLPAEWSKHAPCTAQEEYLGADEFRRVLKMDKGEFAKLPQWKRLQLKKSVSLF